MIKLNNIKDQINFLFDLIFPIECSGCGREGKWLCGSCLEKLSFYQNKYCPICNKESLAGKLCRNCASVYEIDRIFIAGNYKNTIISDLIKKLKFYSVKNISLILGDYLYTFLKNNNALREINLSKTIIIPVPLSRKRFNFRGFNQSAQIGKHLAEKYKIPFCEDLKKIKHTKPQSNLSREERLQNLNACFQWSGENLHKKDILLIDDVITTGSTLNECAKELKKHGARRIWGLVIAKG